jgi:hypothetical protein
MPICPQEAPYAEGVIIVILGELVLGSLVQKGTDLKGAVCCSLRGVRRKLGSPSKDGSDWAIALLGKKKNVKKIELALTMDLKREYIIISALA